MNNESELSPAVCERVVSLVNGATNQIVNVMVGGGRILVSSDPARIGTIHEGARRILAGEVEEIAIDAETARNMQGVRPGYNGAVWKDGRKVACIGVSGDPAVAKPMQKLAALVLLQELDRVGRADRERNLLADVRADINDIAERMGVLAINGAVLAARSGEAGRGFKIVVAEMRKLAAQIGEKLSDLERRSKGVRI